MIKDYDVVLRGHHLILLYRLHFLLDEEDAIRIAMRKKKYSKEFIDFTISFLKKIANTDINVKIVSGIMDDICRRCNRKDRVRKGCYSNGDDFKVILETELQENEVYSSKNILEELLKAAREYQERFKNKMA